MSGRVTGLPGSLRPKKRWSCSFIGTVLRCAIVKGLCTNGTLACDSVRTPFSLTDGSGLFGQSKASAIVAAYERRRMTSTMSVQALGQINAATHPCKQAGPTSRPRLSFRKVNAACSPSAQQRFLSGSRLLKSASPQIVRHRQTSVVASSAAASSPAGTDRGLQQASCTFSAKQALLCSPRGSTQERESSHSRCLVRRLVRF
jgi:hypothetical protein